MTEFARERLSARRAALAHLSRVTGRPIPENGALCKVAEDEGMKERARLTYEVLQAIVKTHAGRGRGKQAIDVLADFLNAWGVPVQAAHIANVASEGKP